MVSDRGIKSKERREKKKRKKKEERKKGKKRGIDRRRNSTRARVSPPGIEFRRNNEANISERKIDGPSRQFEQTCSDRRYTNGQTLSTTDVSPFFLWIPIYIYIYGVSKLYTCVQRILRNLFFNFGGWWIRIFLVWSFKYLGPFAGWISWKYFWW